MRRVAPPGGFRLGVEAGPGLEGPVAGWYSYSSWSMSDPSFNVVKPLLRGVLHQAAFSVSLVIGTLLIVAADGGSQNAAAAIFAGSVATCFGTSALYHRVGWTPRLRLWMRRADHAGVYLLIAGT